MHSACDASDVQAALATIEVKQPFSEAPSCAHGGYGHVVVVDAIAGLTIYDVRATSPARQPIV